MDKEWIEEQLREYPICEYAFFDLDELYFGENIRYICKTECPQYGKTWSCPPGVGSVEECKQRCESYKEGFVFSTIAEVSDITYLDETLATRRDHEDVTRELKKKFLEQGVEVYVLSTESCMLCESCSYPDAPCRRPDKMFPCIESHGILVTDLAEKKQMSFMNGANVVTWFSIILFR